MFSIIEKASIETFKNLRPLLSASRIHKQSSSKLRCLISGAQLLTSKHFSSKDVVPAQKTENDVLLQSIRSASKVDHILETISKYHAIMNSNHSMSALRALFALQKNNCSSFETREILHSNDFRNLCSKLQKQSRTMNTSSLLEALKVVTYFGVPVTSAMVQSLLHVIKHQINDLSLHQITFFHFLCNKFEASPLVGALQIALPIVFETNLKLKMDKEHLSELIKFLQYALQYKLSDASVEVLLQAVVEHREQPQGKAAYQVVLAACAIHKNEGLHIQLAQNSLTHLAHNLESLTTEELTYIMDRVVQKCSKNRDFYNEDFLNACASYVIKKGGFFDAVLMLRKLSQIAHTSLDLLDFIVREVEDKPGVLHNCQPLFLFSLPTGFANMNYKPKNWEQIKDILLQSYKNFHQSNLGLPWVKFALDLAALGSFDDDLLEHVFREDFLEKFLDREYNLLDYLQLLRLYQAVRVLYPEYRGLFPPDHIIEKAKEMNGENVNEFPLKAALEKGLGGEMYVQTKAYTQLGHFIDHAVAVRRGGFPVALNQQVTTDSSSRVYIEDLKIPEDSQIVLILAIPPGSYSLNGKRLRGTFVINIKTLEALGYAVITVSTDDWKSLSDYEKIPYLMQAIRQKSISQFEDANC